MKSSDIFKNCFDSGIGHAELTCECGRHHFDVWNDYDSEFEVRREELRKKEEIDPDKYIQHEHSIGSVFINGTEIVMDCKCDLAQNYEKLIIEYAPQISKYLNERAKSLKEHAKNIEVS
jgi:hypothetical protein